MLSARPRYIIPIVLMLGALIGIGVVAAQSHLTIKAEDVMTAQELKDTGLSSLTSTQRKSFDEWLNRYTNTVYNIATNQNVKESNARPTEVRGVCAPAVESTIAGEFNGWEGETIFKLDNGQIWQQVDYSYTYSYSYRPDVTIYQVSGGCRMKVEDEDETIMVKRIK
jgi:hypothetical protein